MIRRAFREMPFDYTGRRAADLMTSMIHDLYESLNIAQTVKINPNERISGSFCAVSLFRQEVWLVGDCQVILGNQKHSHPKKVDQILSEARALFLYQELLQGATLEELCRKDTGRKFILRDSETALEDILLVDPLLIWKYKSTKGKLKGYVSFDDRAFIKMKLRQPSSQCPTITGP